VSPQPGHANPVKLKSGQTGKKPAIFGSKYQTAAAPETIAEAPAAAASLSNFGDPDTITSSLLATASFI
jgi:hypothetical protein